MRSTVAPARFCPRDDDAAPLRYGARFALSERQYHTAVFSAVHTGLPLLLAANPGEGLAQIGVDALGVAKRRVEYRFHGV